MMPSCIVSRCLVLSLCILISTAQTEGFIEHPMSVSVDRGEQVSLSCTYRTADQGLPRIMWTAPSGILIMPTSTTIDANTLQSTVTFIAATSSYAGDYQCIATVGSNQINSDPATLTVNYYGVQFQESLYTTFENINTFFVSLEATEIGSPSREATLGFTRDDNGPAINNSIISVAGIIDIEGLIPNDEIRLGDREITLTLTTSDNLIEIGSRNTTVVEVTEDDLAPPASIMPSVFRVTTGSDVTFMATEYNATLFPQIEYTWFINGQFILNNNPKYSGQFTRNLMIIDAQEADAGNYTCNIAIGGANGEALGQLFVFAPVGITSHPMNMTVNGTEEATFSVEATGGGLTYQWKKDGVDLSERADKFEGVNKPTLRVMDAQIGDEGFYSCVVSNGAGDTEISNEAFLFTIGLIERPRNMTVDSGELVIFTCTYRSTDPDLPININFNSSPIIGSINRTLNVRTVDSFTQQGTLSFATQSAQVSPAVISGYECVVTIGGATLAISETATLTVSSYSVEFEVQEFRALEALNTFTLPVLTTARGSPSRNAIINFTRSDNGPVIDDLYVATGRAEVEVQVLNDMVRTGDRMFNVTITTLDALVAIGGRKTVTIYVLEDDPAGPGSDAPTQTASIVVLVFSITVALYQFISM